MNRRSFFNIAATGIVTLAGVGAAQAMPVARSLLPASALGQSSAVLFGEEAHVEKAAVVVIRKRIVRRAPRVVIRRTIIRRPRVIVRKRIIIR